MELNLPLYGKSNFKFYPIMFWKNINHYSIVNMFWINIFLRSRMFLNSSVTCLFCIIILGLSGCHQKYPKLSIQHYPTPLGGGDTSRGIEKDTNCADCVSSSVGKISPGCSCLSIFGPTTCLMSCPMCPFEIKKLT